MGGWEDGRIGGWGDGRIDVLYSIQSGLWATTLDSS